MKLIKEAEQDKQGIVFKNYLIHPIKRAFDVKLEKNQVAKLEKVLLDFGRQLKEGLQQQRQLRYKNNVICFTCKDINSMLMAIYCLFLRIPQKDILRSILNEELSQQIPQQKKSTVEKVLITLQRNIQYYLPTNEKQIVRDPLRQQSTQPLLMSYTTNSNQIQINSKLILDVMSVIKNKLDQIMPRLIKHGFKSRGLQNQLKDLPNGKQYCFTFGRYTDEIIVMLPYRKKQKSDEEQIIGKERYKLFLFQNYQCYSTFITKQKKLLKDCKMAQTLQINPQMNGKQNPQFADAVNSKDGHSPQELIPKQQGNINKQTQQQKGRHLARKERDCYTKEIKTLQIDKLSIAHGQTGVSVDAATIAIAGEDVWEGSLNVGVVVKWIVVVVILLFYLRFIVVVIEQFNYLEHEINFIKQMLQCWKPLFSEILQEPIQMLCLVNNSLFK